MNKNYISFCSTIMLVFSLFTAGCQTPDNQNNTNVSSNQTQNGKTVRANNYFTWLWYKPESVEKEGKLEVNIDLDSLGIIKNVNITFSELETADQKKLDEFKKAAEAFVLNKQIGDLTKKIDTINNDENATKILQEALKLIYKSATDYK